MDYVKLFVKQVSTALSNVVQTLPDISLAILTSALLITIATTLKLLDPRFLILSWPQITQNHEYHRLITSFIFFGNLSLQWLMFIISNVRYLIVLERETFATRKREFKAMLVYIYLCCLLASAFVKLPYPSLLMFNSLTYIWTRFNPNAMLVIMQILPVRAQYFPFVNVVLGLAMGQSPLTGLIGIAIGHLYWVIDHVLEPIIGFNVFKKIVRAK
ncbi:Derlin-like_protein [Hexamita inflata]|uniref:Derlin n=1 Tax=Hexamita inflata TaxID=28002 RepID=A0AA86U218_9EUKA|nr:Derlin-like protein [Hexamita inflata]